MEQSKILSLEKSTILVLVKLLALLGVIIIAPFFFNQAITGSVVNAILFISVVIIGARRAVLLAVIPSLIALSVSSLPWVLFPMVPFIMAGNIILIYVFDYARKNNYWLAVILASALKFVFLYSASFLVVNLIIKKQLAGTVSLMMSWPQLLTALAGGVIAYLFLKSIRKI